MNAWFQKRSITEFTRIEFLQFIADLSDPTGRSQTDHNRWIMHFDLLVHPHPQKNGLLFYPEEGKESGEAVAEEVARFFRESGLPGFKDESASIDSASLLDHWFEKRALSDFTRTEFLQFVQDLSNPEGRTEAEDDRWIKHFDLLVYPHPRQYGLLFYPEKGKESDEAVVEEVARYFRENGLPGFKEESGSLDSASLVDRWFTKCALSEFTRTEFLQFVKDLGESAERTERENYRLIRHFDMLVHPHPRKNRLLFYPEKGKESNEAVVEEVARFFREKGLRGFRDEDAAS